MRRSGSLPFVVILGLLVAAAAGWHFFRAGRQAASWDRAVPIPVAGMEPGTVRLVQGFWVARQPGGQFYVFLNKDPHGLHPFEWVESEGVFRSPVLCCDKGPHDEVYRIDGTCKANNCNSSPPASLYRVDARLDGEQLLVVPDRVVSGGFPPVSWWEQVQMKYRYWRDTGRWE
jgi:nitrite reductase/ring-hydroxylating ferredoxin subunit